ncbi:hypothetical protein Ocin01_03023 [Orchesella cincta]|uniref:Uncharacterized protein n=1 Tax=Orchesella cincta TaxID=48709 RepID=A0A1D2NEE2_ORCCI|nr:hypothetical protein Ocin01_03023 [Orchesella cincta]
MKLVKCGDYGTLECNKGNWKPDAKVIGFGLSCPLPLDGKSKTKGKTCLCALKKMGVYDGKTVKTAKIDDELCTVFKKQPELASACKNAVENCLKNSKGYFQDPKTDTEYASWAKPYECIETWVTKKACPKEKKQ